MLSQDQIKKLEAKGGKLWTSKDGSKQRVYFKAWVLPLVETNWKKNGKKTLTYLGEELSHTKSAKLSATQIYIDVVTETVEAGVYDTIAALLADWLAEVQVQEQEQVQKLTKEEAEHYATALNAEQDNKNYVAKHLEGDDWGVWGDSWITTNDYWDFCFYL